MFGSVTTLWKTSNQNLLVYGCCCLAAALICLLLSRYSALRVGGVNAWLKPLKFFLSIALFAFTMAVYVSFLPDSKQVTVYSWSFIVFLSIEVLLITLQAARGRRSHFNTDTPADRLIFAVMGIAIFAILLHTLYLSASFFTQKLAGISDEIVLAIQLSLIVMVLFALEGAVIVALHKPAAAAETTTARIPLLNWNKSSGDLRVAHFFGIHALQLIPLMSYFFAASKKGVFIIATLYFVFVAFTFIQALQGKPLIKS